VRHKWIILGIKDLTVGRPSKLTESQWHELGERLSGGETAASLSREYGVSQTTISQRFSKFPKDEIREVAERLAVMPVQASQATINLADTLRAMNNSAARAGQFGLASAARLQELAHSEVQKIPADAPLEHMETLKGVAALTRTANDAAAMGLTMLNANRETGKDQKGPVPLLLNGSDIHG
jgi:hypothetical protein